MDENAVAKEIVDAAFRIHTTLGPGLLESVYNAVLAHELGRRGLRTLQLGLFPALRRPDPRTTRLYDRRDKKITRNIVERISI